MITSAEANYIAGHAYVPEQLPHYVSAVSRTEPCLLEEFVVHVGSSQLVFVGYPLEGEFSEGCMLASLEQARDRFKPRQVTLIAPSLPAHMRGDWHTEADAYYRLDLSCLQIPKKTRNMLRRAGREVYVAPGQYTREHKKLVKEFIHTHDLAGGTRLIFQRLPEYVKCETTLILEARNSRNQLVAFDIADVGAQNYGFYMFNFRSGRHKVPGASDLLLSRIIKKLRKQGKRYLNLGLGIDPGVEFFKRKWGAIPFLKYVHHTEKCDSGESLQGLFDQFSRL